MNVQDMLMAVLFIVLAVFILIAVGLFGYDQIQDRIEQRDERLFDEALAQLVVQENDWTEERGVEL